MEKDKTYELANKDTLHTPTLVYDVKLNSLGNLTKLTPFPQTFSHSLFRLEEPHSPKIKEFLAPLTLPQSLNLKCPQYHCWVSPNSRTQNFLLWSFLRKPVRGKNPRFFLLTNYPFFLPVTHPKVFCAPFFPDIIPSAYSYTSSLHVGTDWKMLSVHRHKTQRRIQGKILLVGLRRGVKKRKTGIYSLIAEGRETDFWNPYFAYPFGQRAGFPFPLFFLHYFFCCNIFSFATFST